MLFLDTTIERVEIIVMKNANTNFNYNKQAEKWIDLDGTNTVFLRVIYGNHRPITDLNFYRIKYYKGDPHRMVSKSQMINSSLFFFYKEKSEYF